MKPHQSEEAIEAVGVAGAEVVSRPPYSSALTPIEEMISEGQGFAAVGGGTDEGDGQCGVRIGLA